MRSSIDADANPSEVRARTVPTGVQSSGTFGQQDGRRRAIPRAQDEVHRKLVAYPTVLYRIHRQGYPPHRDRTERDATQETKIRHQYSEEQVFAHDLLRGGQGGADRRRGAVQLRQAAWRFTCSTGCTQVGPHSLIDAFVKLSVYYSGG